MISQLTLTLEALCQDGTVLRVPVTKIASVYNTEDALVLHELHKSLVVRPPVYDEDLLQLLIRDMKAALDTDMPSDRWPDGTQPVDLLDRMALMLASQLRCKNSLPPT